MQFEFYREENFKNTEIGKIPEDWDVVRIKDIAEVVSGFGFPVKYQGKSSGKYPFIKVSDMNRTEKYIDFAENYIDDEDIKALRVKIYPPNTIIFPKIGMATYLNKYRILSTWGTFDNNIGGIIPKNIHYEFLYYYFVAKVDLKKLAGQTTAPSIRKSTLESLKVPRLPLPEQKAIADVLSKIDEAIQTVEDSIKQIERIKKGLMQKLLTEGYISGFMFDTNIFNRILDNKIRIEELPKLKYYVTHIQADEISRTPDPERRKKLLEIFRELKQEKIPTESAVFDVSRFGEAKFSDGDLYSKILARLKELDKKARKRIDLRQERDALIAETCIKNNLVLVSDDENLRKVTKEFGGKAISLEQFLEGRYREFKDTEIGKIPEDWEVVKLEKVVEIYDSKRIPLSERERANRKGPYPYCGANGIIDYIDDYIFDGEYVLLAEDGGYWGKFEQSAYIMSGKFWVNNHAHVLRAKERISNNWFLMYVLNFLDLTPYIVGSTRGKLNQKEMRSIKIPLPPLSEQKAIAEILSKVDKLIETKKEKKMILERIKKGMMQKLLTGEIRIKVSE